MEHRSQLDRGPNPLGSLAAGTVSGLVVGLASGRSLYPSWARSALCSGRSARQKYFSARTALALRHSASSSQWCPLEVVFTVPGDEVGLALCLALLTQ